MTDKFQSFITVFIRVDTIIAETNMLRNLRKRRAVSPVIATVILVAVTITVAVAVSYWMSGISGQYTQFEKIEIQTGYAVKADIILVDGEDDCWEVMITLKNSGTTTATIINCFINEQIIGGGGAGELGTVYAVGTLAQAVPVPGDAGGIGDTDDAGITIESGDSVDVVISPILFAFSSSGTTLNVKLHSAAGMDYIRLIQLP